MIIEFLQDYCGRETAMNERKRGEVDDIPAAQAMELIQLRIAREPTSAPLIIEKLTIKKKSKRSEPLRDGGEA